MSRRRHLDHLYALLAELRHRLGGYRFLRDCDGRLDWPRRGVYFFFEPGETRADGQGLRVVRTGTPAGARATLWHRLAQHKGRNSGRHAGGGDHRNSSFRLHVGTALLNTRPYPDAIRVTWGEPGANDALTRELEHLLERDVTGYIGNLPFLWVSVPDEPGHPGGRKAIAAGAAALLSNRGREPLDLPSPGWLGRFADHPAIRESGLWQTDHVDGAWDPAFLAALARHVAAMAPPGR